MTGVVHVLDLAKPLPHDQDFYDDQAAAQRKELLSDKDGVGDHDHDGDHDRDHDHGDSHHHGHSARNGVIAGVGEITATPGGSQSLSVMRFLEPVKVIHAGETIEWNNTDPVTPHTITFGIEPLNPMPPSGNVSVDADGFVTQQSIPPPTAFTPASLFRRRRIASGYPRRLSASRASG